MRGGKTSIDITPGRPNIFLQSNKRWSCVTEDFVEEYMSIHNSDEYKSRAGMFTYL